MSTCIVGIEQPPFYYRPNGASLVERDQTKWLREDGFDVHLVRPKYPDVPETKGELHLPSICLPGTNNYRIAKPLDPLAQYVVDRWVRKLDPDLIYLHGPYQIAGRLAKCAKKYRIPYILHMHTHLSGYARARTPKSFWPLSTKLALGRGVRLANGAALTIFPSETYRSVFRDETGFSGESLVFPSFIEPFPLLKGKELEKICYKLRAGGAPVNSVRFPAIVAYSRLEKEKNCEYALQCFSNLLGVIKNLPIKGVEFPVLIFIGGGTEKYKAKLEQDALQYGIRDKVFFKGACSNYEAKELIQAAHQCWFLSDTDTQGIVPFEIGYAGVPVFGLKDQPFAEFFGGDSLLTSEDFLTVPADSSMVLANKSYMLMKDPVKYRTVAEHCKKIADDFSDTAKYKKDFLDLCQHVVIGAKVV